MLQSSQIINKFLTIKNSEEDPILFLGYYHAKEWENFFKNNGINLNDFLSISNPKDYIVSNLIFDLSVSNHISHIDKNLSKGLLNFFNYKINIIKKKETITSKEEILSYFSGSLKSDSTCLHSVGDPFLFYWIYIKKICSNFAVLNINISSLYENQFNEITLLSRIKLINEHHYLSDDDKFLILISPSFALEHYSVTKNILDNLLKFWPNFKYHFGASTCFTDPIYHLIANFKKINNFGLQHGGGPISVYKDGVNELKLYNQYYFLPPFKNVIVNIRGLISLRVSIFLFFTKLKFLLFFKGYTYFSIQDLFFKPIFRIIKLFVLKIKILYSSIYIKKPIIILSENYRYPIILINNNIEKKDFILKIHPIDINNAEKIIKKFQILGNILPYKGSSRIEFDLYKWSKSYIIVMNYFATLLVYLFEGIAPFLIVLNNFQIKECNELLKDEDLFLFNTLLDNEVIITIEKFYKLTHIELRTLAMNSQQFVKNLTSTKITTIKNLKELLFSKS
jgi:hypothetical protein